MRCAASKVPSIPAETVFSSAPELRSPRTFLRTSIADLKLTSVAAWPLFTRGLQAKYRQAAFRQVAVLFPGLVTAGIWLFLKDERLISLGNTKIPFLVYVLAGIVLWQLFYDCLTAPLRMLGGSRAMLTKSRLPHEAYVLAGVLESLLNFAARLVPLAIVVVFSNVTMRWTILFVPLGVFALVLLGLAIGLLVAPVGLLYPDVGGALVIIAGFWILLTPIFYPPPAHGAAAVILRLNPVSPALTTTREYAFGGVGSAPVRMAVVGIISFVLLVIAWFVYRLARPHLVEEL